MVRISHFLSGSSSSIVKPEFMSMFGERWKYKNAEPSELNIGITVISGIVLAIFGVVYMFTDF